MIGWERTNEAQKLVNGNLYALSIIALIISKLKVLVIVCNIIECITTNRLKYGKKKYCKNFNQKLMVSCLLT